MAALVAQEAGARKLIITHISPRYTAGNPAETDELVEEARSIFPNTEMAYDFLTVEVAHRLD
jgi:ribonuclease Z